MNYEQLRSFVAFAEPWQRERPPVARELDDEDGEEDEGAGRERDEDPVEVTERGEGDEEGDDEVALEELRDRGAPARARERGRALEGPRDRGEVAGAIDEADERVLRELGHRERAERREAEWDGPGRARGGEADHDAGDV